MIWVAAVAVALFLLSGIVRLHLAQWNRPWFVRRGRPRHFPCTRPQGEERLTS